MKTFQSLYDTLLSITKRPDKVALTKRSLVEATLKAHREEFFYPDYKTATLLVEQGPSDISGLRLRSIHVIRHEDTVLYEPHFPTQSPTPENYFYMAGNFLHTSFPVGSRFLLSYFEYPVTSEVNYNSWIADEYEDLVISEAAQRIFSDVGKQEAIAYHRQLVAEAKRKVISEKLFF